MSRLPELTQERLKAYLAVGDCEGAVALAQETYPVSRDEEPPAERKEMFDRILFQAMERSEGGHLPTEAVIGLVKAHGDELSSEALGDILMDTNWSFLFDRTLVTDVADAG